MWQMTIDELISEAFAPEGSRNWRSGMTDYFCPLCGGCVGMYSDGSVHQEGWMMIRDACRNGHRIDWTEAKDGWQE